MHPCLWILIPICIVAFWILLLILDPNSKHDPLVVVVSWVNKCVYARTPVGEENIWYVVTFILSVYERICVCVCVCVCVSISMFDY